MAISFIYRGTSADFRNRYLSQKLNNYSRVWITSNIFSSQDPVRYRDSKTIGISISARVKMLKPQLERTILQTLSSSLSFWILKESFLKLGVFCWWLALENLRSIIIQIDFLQFCKNSSCPITRGRKPAFPFLPSFDPPPLPPITMCIK